MPGRTDGERKVDNVISLNDLFHNRIFRVPDYQRGYSWERRQVREFLEDLELLMPQRSHYTGTVVLHEPPAPESNIMDVEGKTYNPVEIVDGQQRLTTIVLLLDGIRRALAADGFSNTARTLSQGIAKNYIAAADMSGLPLFKLSLNPDTDHFFKTDILAEQPGVEGAEIASEQRLSNAKRQIADYLASKVNAGESDGEAYLRGLYAKIATQLCFTLYQVNDDAEVGVIFEVMNDRGKPLTDLEKVKNFLLHASTRLDLENGLAKSVNDAWSKILQQLMATDLAYNESENGLLRAHWLSHYDPRSKQWNGSRSVKSRFDLRNYPGNHKELLGQLLSYTEALRSASVIYCDAYKPNRSDAFATFKVKPAVRRQVIIWSEKLRRIGVIATFLPLLIAVRERWPDDPDKYLEVLQLCEIFAFRVYRWNGYRSDTGQSAFYRIGYELAVGGRSYGDTVSAIKSEIGYRCRERDFRNDDATGQSVNWYEWGGLRYFLYEYEEHLAAQHNASPRVSWDDLTKKDRQDTIEHVLPQTISGQPYWQDRFTAQDHAQRRHDLGNLTLTMHNPFYGNKPFPDKKGAIDCTNHCYAKSSFYVERDLTRWQDWNAEAIAKRRAKLLEWAKSRWSFDASGSENSPQETVAEAEEYNDDSVIDHVTTDEE